MQDNLKITKQDRVPGPQSYIDAARKFIAENLQDCCNELLDWDETTVLRDGKVREAAAIYRNITSASALSMVRAEVARQAMAHILTCSHFNCGD